jgi:hypothetical protein
MDVSTPEGLASHAETLSDYLYEYGEANPDQRRKYSSQFFNYLLSACWEKLYLRFISWQRLGFIRSFEERVDLLNGHLELIGTPAGPDETYMDRGPGDRTLTDLLFLNEEYLFEHMLPSVLPRDTLPLPLFSKLREAVVEADPDNRLKCLYTKETALEFHYLVYCVFLLSGQAIKQIKDRNKVLKETKSTKKEYPSLVDEFKKCIEAAVLPMKLLQCVLSSTVFKRHICIWTNDGESLDELLPKWPQKADNLRFGIKQKFLAESKKGPSKESPTEGGDRGGGTLKETTEGGGENDSASVSRESPAGDCNDDDNDEDAPEVCKPIC